MSSSVESNQDLENTGSGAIPRFSELAQEGKNAAWRYAVSILLILVLWLGSGLLLLEVPATLAANDGDPGTYVDEQTLVVVGYPILDFTFWTLSWVFMWTGLFVAARFIHRRPFLTMITAYRRVDWRRMAQGFGLYLPLTAAAFCVGYLLNPQDFRLAFEPGLWLAFMPAALALTAIQASAEEAFFRGHLLQLSGLATSNLLVLSMINGVIFVPLHLGGPGMPVPGEGFLLFCLYYVVIGFFLAAVTLKDGGIELAAGVHIAHNFFLTATVTYEGIPNTPTVFEGLDPVPSYTGLAGNLAVTIVVVVAFYLLAFRVFRRKAGPSSSVGQHDDPYMEAP